jgi:hypothetical protein
MTRNQEVCSTRSSGFDEHLIPFLTVRVPKSKPIQTTFQPV